MIKQIWFLNLEFLNFVHSFIEFLINLGLQIYPSSLKDNNWIVTEDFYREVYQVWQYLHSDATLASNVFYIWFICSMNAILFSCSQIHAGSSSEIWSTAWFIQRIFQCEKKPSIQNENDQESEKKEENVIGKPTNWLKMVITFFISLQIFLLSFFVFLLFS